MLIIYTFFALFLALALGLTLLAARLLWRRSHIAACFAACAVLAITTLMFPLPMHGTFTLLGEVLFNELLKGQQKRTERHEVANDENFQRSLEQRFAGRLAFTPLHAMQEPWQRIAVANGLSAYLQSDSGLIWSDMLLWPEAPLSPSLDAARNFCKTLQPEQFWALPTEGELYHFWKSTGQKFSPGAGHRSMAVLIDKDFKLEMPSRYASIRDEYALRCVALGPQAPRAGYTQKDIPIQDWNRFQLEKQSLYLIRRN